MDDWWISSSVNGQVILFDPLWESNTRGDDHHSSSQSSGTISRQKIMKP